MMCSRHLPRRFTCLLLAAGCFLALWLNGCSVRRMMIAEFAQVVENGILVFEQDDDLAMLAEAFPANIKLLEALLAGDPDNQRLLVLLARLYGGYTFALLESDLEAGKYADGTVAGLDDLEARVSRYYQTGAQYGLRALERRRPGARAALSKVTTQEAYLARMTVDDVPALFWYAFNLGAYVNRNLDSVRVIAQANIAEKVMQRVTELDPRYYHSGGHLFLMIYYSARAPMMGGNPPAARQHYDRLKAQVPEDFLLADLFHARYYWVQQQNREAFEKTLRRIATGAGASREFALLNAVAVKRARIYLQALPHFFD